MMKKGEKSMKKVKTTMPGAWRLAEMKPSPYSPEERELLGKYVSPKSEYSHFKGMPMKLCAEVMRLLPSKYRRIVFWAKGESVRKEFAEAFSVYYKVPFLLTLGPPGAGMVTGISPLWSKCPGGVHTW